MYYSLGAARGTQSNGPGAPPRSRRTRPEPFLADAGSGPGNCAGMEETTGAPSSFAALSPRRLRASSRDGGGVVNRPPSPLTMLLSRHTRRRELIAGLAGVAASPCAVKAQLPAMPVIGFLSGRSQDEASADTAAFHQGLSEMGYVEGRNVALEYRWAEGRNELLPDLAADLVRRQVAVLAAVGGNNSALAAKRATAIIPIVFTSSADPVLVALVVRLSHPGGNVTGVSWFDAELGPKQLRLLSELVPDVKVVLLMVNPQSPEVAAQRETAQQAAQALGWQLHVWTASSVSEIDSAFAESKRHGANALMVSSEPR